MKKSLDGALKGDEEIEREGRTENSMEKKAVTPSLEGRKERKGFQWVQKCTKYELGERGW